MVQEEVHGNLSHAMRDNYNAHGVDEYYRKVSTSYRNPFFPGIKKVIWTFMNRWWEEEGKWFSQTEENMAVGRALRVLDMAAGSGEATLCLLEWETAAQQRSSSAGIPGMASEARTTTPTASPISAIASTSIASGTSRGPAGRAPFIPPNARCARPQSTNSSRTVFDKSPLPHLPPGFHLDVCATDPYTVPAYTTRTSRPCHPLSFTDLANGLSPPAVQADKQGVIWDLIICSFALHLVTSPSELFALCYELSTKARWLVVIAPHKKPEVKEAWGWERWDMAAWRAAHSLGTLYGGKGGVEDEGDGAEEETALEIIREKVKLRLYRSTNVEHPS